jgi:hypothetical protein
MDTPEPDLLARLAALDDSQRQAIMSFLAQPDDHASADKARNTTGKDDSIRPSE